MARVKRKEMKKKRKNGDSEKKKLEIRYQLPSRLLRFTLIAQNVDLKS